MPIISEKVQINGADALDLNVPGCSKLTSSYGQEKSYFPELTDPALLSQILWAPMDQMLRENTFIETPESSSVQYAWFNYYEETGWFAPHTHGSCSFAAIYLLHLEEENSTVFANQWTIAYPRYDPFYPTRHLEEGSIIIFPGELMHYVAPAGSSRRVTLSYNIESTYKQKQT